MTCSVMDKHRVASTGSLKSLAKKCTAELGEPCPGSLLKTIDGFVELLNISRN